LTKPRYILFLNQKVEETLRATLTSPRGFFIQKFFIQNKTKGYSVKNLSISFLAKRPRFYPLESTTRRKKHGENKVKAPS